MFCFAVQLFGPTVSVPKAIGDVRKEHVRGRGLEVRRLVAAGVLYERPRIVSAGAERIQNGTCARLL